MNQTTIAVTTTPRRKSSNSSSSSTPEIPRLKSGFDKDHITNLRRELHERGGSPLSLKESPLREKKHSISSTISSTSETNLSSQFYQSLSSTNLSNLKLRRPSHQRSHSSNSLSSKPPPKRPYKKNTSVLSLNNLNLSPGKNDDVSPGYNNGGDNNKGPMDGIDKKTLVDQFYAINEAKPLQDTELPPLTFHGFDNHIKTDAELTSYLLNIDTIMKDYLSQDPDDEDSLQPLFKTLQSVNESLNTINLTSNVDQPTTSIQDISNLIHKLKTFEHSILGLNSLLAENSNKLSAKYKPEIKVIVNKLNDLLMTLDNLEFRLTKTKNLLSECKHVISDDILTTIETLEYIDHRFKSYSADTRKRRFKQLNIGLTISVVLIGMYFSIYR